MLRRADTHKQDGPRIDEVKPHSPLKFDKPEPKAPAIPAPPQLTRSQPANDEQPRQSVVQLAERVRSTFAISLRGEDLDERA